MARCKNSPESIKTKNQLSQRLRQVRSELYGERGGPELSRRLGIPIRTWYNYEMGVTVPAEVLLRFVDMTGVEPLWLLHGQGPKYRKVLPPLFEGDDNSDSVTALLRQVLERLERGEGPVRSLNGSEAAAKSETPSPSSSTDAVLIPVENAERREGPGMQTEPNVLAVRRDWLGPQGKARSIRVEGDAMAPILRDGAYVGFDPEEKGVTPEQLDGQLVVTWVEKRPIVRWFQLAGRFALLRAENDTSDAKPHLIPIQADTSTELPRVHRVLWTCTPHAGLMWSH